MVGRYHINRHGESDDSAGESIAPNAQPLDVEKDIVVRLFPEEFHWVEVDAEYLGPARPRIPRELARVDD
ncbi:MAG TPA: hypothetical protein VH482_09025 [Thermomicrobiales bacterium]